MDWKTSTTTFALIFLAEMGDKTQIAAISMVAKTRAPWEVFLGTSLALVVVSLLAVLFGQILLQYIPVEVVHKIAAVAFIVIGVLMLVGKG